MGILSDLKILCGCEPSAKESSIKACPHKDSALAGQGEGAVEANHRFIHNHWDEYPESTREHFRNQDIIYAYEREIDILERLIRNYASKMKEFIELTEDAREAGFKLRGVHKILTDYDDRILCATVKLESIPGVEKLRQRNCELEAIAKADGWILWHGTGGMHWNKKGIIEDGYGVYGRKIP